MALMGRQQELENLLKLCKKISRFKFTSVLHLKSGFAQILMLPNIESKAIFLLISKY